MVPTGESQDISFHRTVELEFFGLDQKGKKIKVGCGKRAEEGSRSLLDFK